VSFYKGIGGIAGAILAGPGDFIDEARIWMRRHGGNLISLHPFVLSARAGLAKHAGAFSDYRKRAQAIAARLSTIEGITIVPPVPCTLMMHLHIAAPADALNEANHKLAVDSQVMLFGKASARGDQHSKVEISIGAAASALRDDEIEALFRHLLATVR
jgi:threonine aldolase